MKQLTAIAAIVLLASCATTPKKVIVISEGTANVNTDNRTISVAGKGHEEKTVLFHDEGKVELQLTTPEGTATVPVEQGGVYILNAKTDTIVGSFVNYTAPKKSVDMISQDEMLANIDSLQQILSGKVSAEKKTFYILPRQAVLISTNPDATVITPFHQMTSIAVKKGETPEVYRFYPISEVRATLEKLKVMAGESEKPVNDPQ